MHMFEMLTGQGKTGDTKVDKNVIHSHRNAECIQIGLNGQNLGESEDRKSELAQPPLLVGPAVCISPSSNPAAPNFHLRTHAALGKLKLPPVQELE